MLELKEYCSKSIGFFNDSSTRCPKINNVASAFDKAFSFEKDDCKNLKLDFAPNWINREVTTTSEVVEYQVFNISSKDKRFLTISKIASELKSKKIKYKFMILDKNHKITSSEIDLITKKVSLDEISKYVEKSQALLDVNRKGQKGLTFRIFESIGLEKKLITTNRDIVNYDFYNPNNILVIDEENPEIPASFFESSYQKLPSEIYNNYTINAWTATVLSIK